MTNITEHDSEEERERDHGKQPWVDFLVGCNSIAVHDGLEALRELIRSDERGWRLVGAKLLQYGYDVRSRLFLVAE